MESLVKLGLGFSTYLGRHTGAGGGAMQVFLQLFSTPTTEDVVASLGDVTLLPVSFLPFASPPDRRRATVFLLHWFSSFYLYVASSCRFLLCVFTIFPNVASLVPLGRREHLGLLPSQPVPHRSPAEGAHVLKSTG